MPNGELQTRPSVEEIRAWLAEVPDPEIPVLSVLDLGIVRDIKWEGDTLIVATTPTYSGCPATAVIDLAIEAKLRAKGIGKIRLERRLFPPWTTAWLSPAAHDKLRAYGIAPPVPGARATGRVSRLLGAPQGVACPRCGSTETEEVSRFGSTPCKAAWRCKSCLEPFDYFKCH